VALGLSYLHNHAERIVHRDLHIRNVMVSPAPPAPATPYGLHAVLIDFNCGTRLVSHSRHTAYAGHPAIVPPECRAHSRDALIR
jgi:serine/threonine protein kinase